MDDITYSHSLYPNDVPNGDIVVMDWYENYAGMSSGLSASQQLGVLQQDRSWEKSAYKQILSFLVAGKDIRCVMTIDNSKYSFTICSKGFGDIVYGQEYADAVSLMEEGKYADAYEAFVALGEYKDSVVKADECLTQLYVPLLSQITSLQKEQSLSLTEALAIAEADGSYKDSDESISTMESLAVFSKCEGTYSL